MHENVLISLLHLNDSLGRYILKSEFFFFYILKIFLHCLISRGFVGESDVNLINILFLMSDLLFLFGSFQKFFFVFDNPEFHYNESGTGHLLSIIFVILRIHSIFFNLYFFPLFSGNSYFPDIRTFCLWWNFSTPSSRSLLFRYLPIQILLSMAFIVFSFFKFTYYLALKQKLHVYTVKQNSMAPQILL